MHAGEIVVNRLSKFLAAIVIGLPLAVTAADTGAVRSGGPIYLDRSYSPAERAADLVSRLSPAEKASQMVSSRAAGIPRLGIAAYGWWNEAAHGVAREQTNDGDVPPDFINTTSYPVSLSLGATWDPGLVYREATLISDEAREIVTGNRYDLDFYSPTVNLARDPRWGRNDETFGEDPVLTAALASQYVDGLQGQSPSGQPLAGTLKAIATIKHYAANNSESNRLNGSSDMDERTLREYYTAQFRDIIAASHPGAIMSAYNSVNGVPAAANVHLIDTLARQTYGFGGYFTSDCDAVFVMQNGQDWPPIGNQWDRTAFAQTAGEDLDCDQGYHDQWNYADTIPEAIARGIHTPAGVFNINDVDVSLVRLFTARIELGEFDAEDQVPWVAAARARLAPGTWTNTDANHAVTETPARLSMARKVADESIVMLKNSLLPLRSPGRILVVGPYADPPALYLGGYSSDQGRSGAANEVSCYQGIRRAFPHARVDFLRGTPPGDDDDVDPAAVAAAAHYDVAVVCAGTNGETASEDHDRATLDLPGSQTALIQQVAKANKHTVVYLETVGQVNLPPFQGVAAAILWSSFNGQQQGLALGDVLSGAVSPSGHLPFTWYADENQLPPAEDYDIRPTATTRGRTYQYFTGSVAYPFGFGLSYSTFRYSDLQVTPSLQVTATVTNTGAVPAATVAQLYATTPDAPASAQRPRSRLVGFRKVALAPHASTRVTIPVRPSDLAFFGPAGVFRLDPGRYGLQLSTSSAPGDIQLRAYVVPPPQPQLAPSVVTAKPVTAGDAERGIAQRVFFPPDASVDPQLTVALTDQSLYGYVTAGQSRPLPPGLTVTYTSNRPSVVAADGNHLRTRDHGVATVTARVTYHGATASGSFVVGVT
jgi:beta-glucosidase